MGWYRELVNNIRELIFNNSQILFSSILHLVSGILQLVPSKPLYFFLIAIVLSLLALWAAGPWTVHVTDPPDWTGINTYIDDGQLVTASGTVVKAKTLWDWLDLIIGGVIVGSVLAISGYYLNQSARDTDREISADRLRQQTLEAYLDRMSELLIDDESGFFKPKGGERARIIARTRTMTTLRTLDGDRRGLLLIFLHESELVKRPDPFVKLSGAYLHDADLRFAALKGAKLCGADLTGVDLFGAALNRADLSNTIVDYADFRQANLCGANLTGIANLDELDLTSTEYDSDTVWPQDFDPEAAGAVLVESG